MRAKIAPLFGKRTGTGRLPPPVHRGCVSRIYFIVRTAVEVHAREDFDCGALSAALEAVPLHALPRVLEDIEFPLELRGPALLERVRVSHPFGHEYAIARAVAARRRGGEAPAAWLRRGLPDDEAGHYGHDARWIEYRDLLVEEYRYLMGA